MSARVWYQSFVSPTEQSSYMDKLSETLNHYSSESISFDVHGIEPPDTELHPISEMRCAIQTIENAITANKQNYDAFVIGHFQEPGLMEARGCTKDMPIIGLGECNMLLACSLGQRIGLVTINPIFIQWHQQQINALGLQDRVIAVRAVETSVKDYEDAFTDTKVFERVKQAYLNEIDDMRKLGVEVIIPAGGLPMLLLASKESILPADDILVQNGIAVCAQYTEMMINLHQQASVVVSRKGNYKQASDVAIAQFLAKVNC